MKNNISHQSSGFLRDGYGMAIPGLEANPISPRYTDVMVRSFSVSAHLGDVFLGGWNSHFCY